MTRIYDLEALVNTLRDIKYPVSIRDVGPHPDAIRLTGINPDGLPGGMHTGGAWLLNNCVYKPLDGRPHAGSLYHFGTRELECLIEMQDLALFPVNWWVEEHNDRYFLVRTKGYLIPDDVPYDEIDREKALYVEEAICELNRRGWEVNDAIALAIDPGPNKTLYLYDLSAAQRMNGKGAYAADDGYRVMQFLEISGNGWIVKVGGNPS